MKVITPIHQFEIRYSNILNFPHVIGEVLSPFVKLASRVKIDQENSRQEKLTLFFDEEQYFIITSWDRIIIKKENLTQDLSENNSIIESPFLDIFAKVKEVKGFGEVANFLFYSLNVKIIDKPIEEFKNNFLNQRLNKSFIEKLSAVSDVGVNLEFNVEDKSGNVSVGTGPYFGLEEIKKRGQNLIYFIPEELEKTGELIEFRYIEIGKKFSFPKYKEIKRIQDKYLAQLWTIN